MKGWEEKTLDELGTVGRGKSRHRPRNAPHLYGGNYPFIQTGDIEAALFYVNSYSNTYSDAGLAQSKLWAKNTLCISIVGANTAATAILGFDACFPDSVIGFVPDESKSDVKFVKYSLEAIRYKLKNISEGAARENLSLEKLLSVKMPIPPIEYQKKIVSIVSPYDDLIENNLRRIKLLEELAQRTYEEWFVKFRVNGEQLMVNEEMGLPAGWEKKKLIDVAFVNKNSLKKGFSGKLKYVDISSVSTGSIDSFTEYEFEDAPGRAKRVVKHGDIIWSCVRPNRKSYCLICNPEENLIVSTGFAVITPIKLPTSYLYLFVTTEAFVGYLTNLASGAAYPAVTSNVFENAEVVIPTEDLLDSYDSKIRPTIELIEKLSTQNRHLKESRDLLLPRLMSGALAVKSEE